MASVSEQILDRAAAVRELGEWIGTFEFLVFSQLKHYDVNMYIGAGCSNLREIYAPGLGPIAEPLGVCHVIGCKVIGFGLGLPEMVAGSPSFNHWVIGVPLTGSSPGVSHVKDVDFFKVVMAGHGLAVLETQALGDCGIDVMSHALALKRCASTYKKLRSELAEFMVHCATDPVWHDIWSACCEAAPVMAPPVEPSISPPAPPVVMDIVVDEASAEPSSAPDSALASADSPLASAALASASAPLEQPDSSLASATLALAPAPSTPPVSPFASVALSPASAPSTPPPLPPPALAPAAPEASAVSLPQEQNAVASFRQHLLSLEKDELALITGSFDDFKAVEDWGRVRIRAHTYVRTNERTHMRLRMYIRACVHALLPQAFLQLHSREVLRTFARACARVCVHTYARASI